MQPIVYLAALAIGAAPGAQAATHFGLRQIKVNGSTAVGAQAINNSGTIAGGYSDANGAHGFIRKGKQVTLLPLVTTDCPSQSGCVAVPQAINTRGDAVAVFLGQADTSVLWKHGAYVANSYTVISGNGGAAGIVGFNNADEEAFNFDAGLSGYYPEAGIPPNVSVIVPPGYEPLLSGLNNKGVQVGTTGVDVNGSIVGAVFFGQNGAYQTITPPGAYFIASAAINNHGTIAGTFTDTQNVYHGFVYANGTYTTFDAPVQPLAMTVIGINDSGRVIGVYTDASHKVQRLFWFNGSKFLPFGKFGEFDALHAALNDRNAGIVQDSAGGALSSYSFACSGAAC